MRVLEDLVHLIHQADLSAIPEILGALAHAEAEGLIRLRTLGPQHDVGGTASAPVEPDVNVSADEAARRLCVSKDWLYRNADKLPFARRIGRRLVFSTRGLERWCRQQATTP